MRRLLFFVIMFVAVVRPTRADPTPGRPSAPSDAASLGSEVLRRIDAGRFREALPLAEQAVRLSEAAEGSDGPTVAVSLSNLAVILRELGQYERAKYRTVDFQKSGRRRFSFLFEAAGRAGFERAGKEIPPEVEHPGTQN